MKLIRYSKKGTTSVFLTMILASIIAVTALFIHAGAKAAGNSYADAVFELAGRTILSEYDLKLLNRYGLFAVHTDERQVEKKIQYCVDYSFHDNIVKEAVRNSDYIYLIKPKLKSVHVNLRGFSMTDTGLFEQQILAYMKTGIIKDHLSENKPYVPSQKQTVLRNEQIINSLPSSGYNSSIFQDIESIAENGIPSLGEIKNNSNKTFLVDEYILSHFYNHRRGNDKSDTFFQNEVEYVLKGKLSDQRNYSAVRSDLFIIRNVLNFAHIVSDPVKRNKVIEIAAILTLGEGTEIGMIAVAEAWALAETENDLRLIEDGKEVALIKAPDNWAVPISSTLTYISKDKYYRPKNMKGYDYEDYLRILLFLEDREKKLMQCMDLIQINMKGSYYSSFDLKEYYGGFQFEAVTREKKYTYVQKY